MKPLLPILILVLCGLAALAEDITLATCNVEYFDYHFLADRYGLNNYLA
jgi:hypothetical protein